MSGKTEFGHSQAFRQLVEFLTNRASEEKSAAGVQERAAASAQHRGSPATVVARYAAKAKDHALNAEQFEQFEKSLWMLSSACSGGGSR